MSESTKKFSGATLYKTPFSRAYWAQAASEFKSLKMLLFAALMIALRVALKPVGIPIAADLRINAGFFVNAFGAAAFGPVVAIPAAAISDLLGCILFPQGVYYPPFMLTEIAGSVIFALFFYRAEITPLRVILARFCVNFFVNILLQTPLMRGYYAFIGSSALYPLFDTVRIAKNIVLFPVEAVLLMLFLRAVVPPVQKLGYIHSVVNGLSLSKAHIILLAALFLYLVLHELTHGAVPFQRWGHDGLCHLRLQPQILQRFLHSPGAAGAQYGNERLGRLGNRFIFGRRIGNHH